MSALWPTCPSVLFRLRHKLELLSKGEKLSYAALAAARMTNANGSIGVLTSNVVHLRAARMNARWLNLRQYVGPGQARALCRVAALNGNTAGSETPPPWEELAAELFSIESPLAEIREAMKEPQGDWGVATNLFRGLSDFIAIPNFLKAMDAGARTDTERQLAMAAIALARFQLVHGAFPASLEKLVPDYLATAPKDLMNGKPLSYRLRSDRTPLLYSVGTDGTDHDGDPAPSQPGIFGLWEGVTQCGHPRSERPNRATPLIPRGSVERRNGSPLPQVFEPSGYGFV